MRGEIRRDMRNYPPEHLRGKMGGRIIRISGRFPQRPERLPLAILRSASIQIRPRKADEIPHGTIRLLGEMKKREIAHDKFVGVVIMLPLVIPCDRDERSAVIVGTITGAIIGATESGMLHDAALIGQPPQVSKHGAGPRQAVARKSFMCYWV